MRLFSFPAVVKPDKNLGFRGTVVASDPADRATLKRVSLRVRGCPATGAWSWRSTFSLASRATIEGEVFAHGEDILWDGLFLTVRCGHAATIPATYVFLLQEERASNVVKDVLFSVFEAAGVRYGEYNVEAYVTESGEPFVIKISPRQGGNDLPRYVHEHCGVDLTRLLATTSVGDEGYWNEVASLERTRRRIVHHMLYPSTRVDSLGYAMRNCLRSACIAPSSS